MPASEKDVIGGKVAAIGEGGGKVTLRAVYRPPSVLPGVAGGIVQPGNVRLPGNVIFEQIGGTEVQVVDGPPNPDYKKPLRGIKTIAANVNLDPLTEQVWVFEGAGPTSMFGEFKPDVTAQVRVTDAAGNTLYTTPPCSVKPMATVKGGSGGGCSLIKYP